MDCLVCKASLSLEPDFLRVPMRVDCPRCKVYLIARPYDAKLAREGPNHLLCGVIRDFNERGSSLPVIDERSSEDLVALAPTSVPERARRLLYAIARDSERPGAWKQFVSQTDYPLVYGSDPSELAFFADYLYGRGYLKEYSPTSGGFDCSLSVAGWAQVEADKQANFASDTGFVAMWFNDEMKPAYDNGLRPGIEDAGYKAIRVDDVEHNNKIDDRIIAEIRESRFVVSDFTGQRNGVYFEAGFAMGLGLPVIWTVREDEIQKVHFDTRQYNHIVWKDAAQLRERLSERIRAAIGRGPLRGEE